MDHNYRHLDDTVLVYVRCSKIEPTELRSDVRTARPVGVATHISPDSDKIKKCEEGHFEGATPRVDGAKTGLREEVRLRTGSRLRSVGIFSVRARGVPDNEGGN